MVIARYRSRDMSASVLYDPALIRSAVPVRPRAVWPHLDRFLLGESFGHRLVEQLVRRAQGQHRRLLDPFAGAGSSLWSAQTLGMEALGIEQLPYAHFCFQTASRTMEVDVAQVALIGHWLLRDEVAERDLDISEVPLLTRVQVGPGNASCAVSYREALRSVSAGPERDLLLFVLMKTLRLLRRNAEMLRLPCKGGLAIKDREGNFHASFDTLFQDVLFECLDDLTEARLTGTGLVRTRADLLFGSAFDLAPALKEDDFDLVITSPPYLNGFDYLQEYETEHWCLGLGDREISGLKRALIPTRFDPKDEGLEPGPNLVSALGLVGPVPGTALLYFQRLSDLFEELYDKLQDGAEVFLVVDDIVHDGEEMPVAQTLSALVEDIGYQVVAIYTDSPGQPLPGLGRERRLTKVCHWKK